jgi:hypothetical protein
MIGAIKEQFFSQGTVVPSRLGWTYDNSAEQARLTPAGSFDACETSSALPMQPPPPNRSQRTGKPPRKKTSGRDWLRKNSLLGMSVR